MKLMELIIRHHWLSIQAELIRLYPDEKKQIDAYERVLDRLLEMALEPSEIVIRLTEIREDDTYVDVHGYHADGRVDPLSGNDALALDFTPWNQWLGMQVDEKAFDEFTELEIIAHCLYEMTFISFDQQEIKEQLEGLTRTMEDYKNMTPEEKKSNTRSLEDFLDELGDEGDG